MIAIRPKSLNRKTQLPSIVESDRELLSVSSYSSENNFIAPRVNFKTKILSEDSDNESNPEIIIINSSPAAKTIATAPLNRQYFLDLRSEAAKKIVITPIKNHGNKSVTPIFEYLPGLSSKRNSGSSEENRLYLNLATESRAE